MRIHLLPARYFTGISGIITHIFPKTPISLIIDERADARDKEIEIIID
jgi:hypothetical protein